MAGVKQLTLCFVIDGERILLGMKKRGFGTGWWNGFGGKIEEGETEEAAARRELVEESGITAHAVAKVGMLDFSFPHEQTELRVHVFTASDFEGQPAESEEMAPRWFGFDEVPFEHMWPDDRLWFPLMLAGKRFEGRFVMGEGNTLLSYELKEVA